MPTLADTLKQNQQNTQLVKGADGVLSEQKPATPINQLAGQQGLAVAPTTALGGALVGANPDQQKMLGGPAQLNAIANNNQNQQSPNNNLQTSLRRQQSRTDATGQEQQEMQKSTAMQNLGGLGDRVTNFINTQKQNLETQAQQAADGQGVAVSTQDQFNGKDITAYKDDLAALRANPSDMNMMLKVQQELGMDASKQLAPEQINQLYQDSVSAISQGGAQTVADKLQVNDLLSDPNFGYDINSLSGLLGVPAAQLSGMSIGQLRDQVDRVTQQEFTNTQQLQQKAQSGQLGVAERGLAQQGAREASTTGLRASEDDMNRLTQSIQNADQVNFGGKTYKVDDLLQDDTISGIIKEYLQAGPDSDLVKTVNASEPQLADFIQKNQNVLTDASNKLSAGATQFSDIQSYNKGLASSAFGGIQMNDSVMSALTGGKWGQLQSSKIDPQSVPLLAYSSNLPQDRQQAVANKINSQVATDPTIANQLSSLSQDQVAGLGIDKTGSNWDKMIQANQTYQTIQNADPTRDLQSLLNVKYTNIPSADQYNQDVVKGRSLNALGIDSGMDLSQTDPSSLKQSLLSQTGQVNLANAAIGNIPTVQKTTWKSPNLPSQDTADGQIYKALGSLAMDGSLSADDLKSPQAQKLDLDQTKRLEDLANSGKGNLDKNAVVALRQTQTDKATNDKLAQASTPGDPSDQLNKQLALVGKDPRDLNTQAVNSSVLNTLKHELDTASSKDVPEFLNRAMKAGVDINSLRPSMEKYISDRGGVGTSAMAAQYDLATRVSNILKGLG